MIENPFESGHIKNYILLYASVVVIVILFFIASSFFIELKDVEKKIFSTEIAEDTNESKTQKERPSRFKLLDREY